jgi:Na+/melibiose symporter-like transporter
MIPIFGYRRKIYLIICALINMFCWAFMSFNINSATSSCITLLIINFSLSFSSVLGQAILVEVSHLQKEDKENYAKSLVSWYFMCLNFGEITSSYLKGLFVDLMKIRLVFLIGSFLPLLLIISAFILKERRINFRRHEGSIDSEVNEYGSIEPRNAFQEYEFIYKDNLWNKLSSFLKTKEVIFALLFILFLKSTPAFYDVFFYYITNELKFNATMLGKSALLSAIAVVISISLYQRFFQTCNFKTMMIIGTISSFILTGGYYILALKLNDELEISNFKLYNLTTVFLSIVNQFVDMPILSLACVICPKYLEATVNSIFLSTFNFGGTISRLIGSFSTIAAGLNSHKFDNLYIVILVAKISNLFPLLLLFCIETRCFEPVLDEEYKSDESGKSESLEEEKLDKVEKESWAARENRGGDT